MAHLPKQSFVGETKYPITRSMSASQECFIRRKMGVVKIGFTIEDDGGKINFYEKDGELIIEMSEERAEDVLDTFEHWTSTSGNKEFLEQCGCSK